MNQNDEDRIKALNKIIEDGERRLSAVRRRERNQRPIIRRVDTIRHRARLLMENRTSSRIYYLRRGIQRLLNELGVPKDVFRGPVRAKKRLDDA